MSYYIYQVKIMYTVSYLKGTAQCWYEPNLSLDDDDLPEFALTWGAFEEALKATFGEPNPIASTTFKLDNLFMKDHQHVTCYNIEFNEYASLTGFETRLVCKILQGPCPAHQGRTDLRRTTLHSQQSLL